MQPTWAWPPPASECLARPLPPRELGPVAAAPVDVVGAALHQAVDVRVEVLAVHALVVAAGDDVEEVVDDAVGDEHLAVVVEVEAPGVGGAVGDASKILRGRVIAPDAAVDGDALLRRRARPADAATWPGCRCSRRASRPAPRSRPLKTLCLRLEVPAVERRPRRAGRLVVAVAIGMNSRFGDRAEPDAAEAELDAGEVRRRCRGRRSLVERAVAVGVFEDDDAVVARLPSFDQFGYDRHSTTHSRPRSSKRERDRLDDVRLAGEQRRPGRTLGEASSSSPRRRRHGPVLGARQMCGDGEGGQQGEDAAVMDGVGRIRAQDGAG